MTADAMKGDRLIALALLKPGCETHASSPAFHEMLCLARIETAQPLAAGGCRLLLKGVHRAVVVDEPGIDELTTDAPYRRVRLELYRDFYPREPHVDRESRGRELLLEFRELFPRSGTNAMFAKLLDVAIPLGTLCDLLATASPLPIELKQELLDEVDVVLGRDLLLRSIREVLRSTRDSERMFPPGFSAN
jgi:Lon protease-like protein